MAEERLTGWRLYVSWFGLFIIGWVIFGAVFKVCILLFFLGWDLL